MYTSETSLTLLGLLQGADGVSTLVAGQQGLPMVAVGLQVPGNTPLLYNTSAQNSKKRA